MWCWAIVTLLAAVLLYRAYCDRQRRSSHATLSHVYRLAKFPRSTDGAEDLCLELLTKFRISPNSKKDPQDGWTPFLAACFGGSLTLIQCMLDHGADLKQTNADGDTALYMAVLGISQRVHTAQGSAARSREVLLGTLIVDCLINAGCDINIANNHGYTPLHWAAAQGELWLVDHLLKREANPFFMTKKSGALPSTCASKLGYHRVKTILERAEQVKSL